MEMKSPDPPIPPTQKSEARLIAEHYTCTYETTDGKPCKSLYMVMPCLLTFQVCERNSGTSFQQQLNVFSISIRSTPVKRCHQVVIKFISLAFRNSLQQQVQALECRMKSKHVIEVVAPDHPAISQVLSLF